MKKTIVLLAVSGLALAACHNKTEEPVAETNVTNMVVETGNVANIAVETPAAVVPSNATTTAVAPSAALTADEQTVEDADATGMTAKVNRDEGGNSASGQPAN